MEESRKHLLSSLSPRRSKKLYSIVGVSNEEELLQTPETNIEKALVSCKDLPIESCASMIGMRIPKFATDSKEYFLQSVSDYKNVDFNCTDISTPERCTDDVLLKKYPIVFSSRQQLLSYISTSNMKQFFISLSSSCDSKEVSFGTPESYSCIHIGSLINQIKESQETHIGVQIVIDGEILTKSHIQQLITVCSENPLYVSYVESINEILFIFDFDTEYRNAMVSAYESLNLFSQQLFISFLRDILYFLSSDISPLLYCNNLQVRLGQFSGNTCILFHSLRLIDVFVGLPMKRYLYQDIYAMLAHKNTDKNQIVSSISHYLTLFVNE